MELGKSLIQGMRQHKESSFSACYQQVSPMIYSIILRIMSSESVAEDLMQESFIQAFNSLLQLKDDSKFIPWLKRIAFNKAMNFIRSQKTTVEFSEETHTSEDNNVFTTDIANNNQLACLLESLPQEERLVLWLFSVEGYSHKEIATMTNKTISYSKSVVFRSLAKMRKEHEKLKESL